MNTFNDDKIYEVVRNKTTNMKLVFATLNGMEIAPGQTVNLRQMFRKAQLADAMNEIFHFIKVGYLEEIESSPEPEAPTAPQAQPLNSATTPANIPASMPEDIKAGIQKKAQEAKDRDIINELQDCSLVSRLEDILLAPDSSEAVKKTAKIRYMTLRGWIDDDGKLIEGSADDDMQDITSIEAWEFKPLNTSKVSGS